MDAQLEKKIGPRIIDFFIFLDPIFLGPIFRMRRQFFLDLIFLYPIICKNPLFYPIFSKYSAKNGEYFKGQKMIKQGMGIAILAFVLGVNF